MKDLPAWFNPDEYSNFLMESVELFETPNIPFWKERSKSRKQMMDLEREHAIRKSRLKAENMRDEGRAKARGIQMGLGEEFIQHMSEQFLAKLLEANNPLKSEKRKIRPEVDPADRDRDRKREQRRQDNQTPLSNILIVRNKNNGKLEIITKDDYEQDRHEVLKGKVKNIDKGSISKSDLIRVSKKAEFINTKTSMKLIGKVEKETDEGEGEKGGGGESSAPQSMMPPPPMPRVPQDGKEITDPKSTYPDWDHNSQTLATGIAYGMNTANGVAQMPPEFAQAMSNSRTLADSVNRAINELISSSPALQGMEFLPLPPVVNTSQSWNKAFETPQSAPVASLVGRNEQGEVGIALKIGEQIRPTEKAEAGQVFAAALGLVSPEQVLSIFSLMFEDMLADLRKVFTTVVPNLHNTTTAEDSLALTKLKEIKRKKMEFEDSKNIFINRVKGLIEAFLNTDENLKAAFLLEAIGGNTKFEGGLGSAKLMITMKKDGTDATVVPVDPRLGYKLAAADSVYLNIKFTEAAQPDSYIQSLYQKLVPLNESALEVVMDLEKIKDQITTPEALMQLFELQIADITYKSPVDYSDYFDEDSDSDNIVVLNPGSKGEKEVRIPVARNYTPTGIEQNVVEKGIEDVIQEYFIVNDYLVDSINSGKFSIEEAVDYMSEEFNFLTEGKKKRKGKKKRNYRKEYDEYHGTAEQRANRSKRVLARRKMMKKGRVRKGDGKDVDHKNGNPKDNSDNNLRVLSKSKNRSIKEDHGAGFEGTSELIEVLKKGTPGAETTPALTGSKKYTETKHVNNKKK